MRQVEEIDVQCGVDLIETVNKRLAALTGCNPTVQFLELYGNAHVIAYITYDSTLRKK